MRPSSDRKTEAEIIRKMQNTQTQSVVAEVNGLEKQPRAETFKKFFKSITADGDSEFMDFEGIENSPMVQKGQLCILHIHIVQVNGGQMQGLSMKEKYSKVMLWRKGYYLNK